MPISEGKAKSSVPHDSFRRRYTATPLQVTIKWTLIQEDMLIMYWSHLLDI